MSDKSSKVTGPLFKWFGSKWLSSKHLPAPRYDTIIEPFAGGAGYSLRYADRKVVIAESNSHLHELWQWLIRDATEALIREIPLSVPVGTNILSLGLSRGQSLLLKTWQRTNNVGDCWTISPWGNLPGQWTANTRARVASEVDAVRHWELWSNGIPVLHQCVGLGAKDSTFFVDPPYLYNYQYKAPLLIGYSQLGMTVGRLAERNQVIVCEAIEPKTGRVPDWLPFTAWQSRVTSRRKADCQHHSKELLWTNG